MLKGILFDLDGTLVNTDPIHFQTWQELLRDYGMKIDEEFYTKRISGGLNPQIIQEILPQLSPAEGQEVADAKEAQFRQLATGLQPLPGLSDLLQWTESQGLKQAIVTNAPRENVDFILKILGLTETFPSVILAQEVAAAKPDPAIYQLALQQLNLTPEEAIAFEDSPTGIRAAVGANLKTIGITTSQDPKILQDLGAFIAIPDFTHSILWEFLHSLVFSPEQLKA